MKKIPDLRIGLKEVLDKRESTNLILDEKNSSTDLLHGLSVFVLSENTNLNPPVLWLDGDNSFNPYRISEIARSFGIRSEQALQEIYISRAFTCYQMMSLIFEKLGKAVEKYGPEFIIITGLPELFSNSDLPKQEALRAFKPVAEYFENLKNADLTIYLTTQKIKEENKFVLELETISNHVIGSPESRKPSGKEARSFHSLTKKNTNPQATSKTPSLEEFA